MRIYEVSTQVASTTGNKTVILLQAPSDAVLLLLEAHVYATQDDTNEQLEVDIRRGTTLGSPTGTSLTPHPHSLGDAVAGGTYTGDLSAEPTAYAATRHGRRSASSLAGWSFQAPSLQEAFQISPSGFAGIFVATFNTAKILMASAVFAEVGG